MITKPALMLLSLPVAVTLSAKEKAPAPAPVAHVQPGHALTPGGIVAGQISDILETKGLSEKSRKRQIGNAVRIAVSSATTNLRNADDALAIILEIAERAGGAAPEFSDVIGEAVLEAAARVPVLAEVKGLKVSVDNAVFAGVKQAATSSGEARFDSSEGRSRSRGQGQGGSGFGGNSHDVVVSPSDQGDQDEDDQGSNNNNQN